MRRARVATLFVMGATCAVLVACEPKRETPDAATAPSTNASASTADATAPSLATSHVTPPPSELDARAPVRSEAPCRLLETTGIVRLSGNVSGDAGTGDAGAPLLAGAVVKRGEVLELERATSVAVKDGESGREFRVEGPAKLVPCAASDEIWMARGTLSLRPGSADSPLAELAVVVDTGVVRVSGGASYRIEVEPRRTVVRAHTPRPVPAFFAPRDAKLNLGEGPSDAGADASASAPHGVDSGTKAPELRVLGELVTSAKGPVAIANASAECAERTKEAAAIATRMLDKDASLADLSPKSMEASRAERSACAVEKMRRWASAP